MSNNPKPDPLTEYHRFVGSFITEYARLEFVLRYVLERMSGMDDATYRVLVGFPRSSDVIKKVKTLAETRKLSDESKAAIDDTFSQLRDITEIRDRILHRSEDGREGKKRVRTCSSGGWE